MRTDPSVMPKGPLFYGKCRLIINELSLAPVGGTQFIELKKVCEVEPGKNFVVRRMDKYKILFVDNSGHLIVVCKLMGEGTTSDGDFYYVIGGEGVNKVNMQMRNCHFAADADESKENRFPVGDRVPVGIMLVYNDKTSAMDDLDLDVDPTGRNPSWKKVAITSGGKIMKYLQDMVIHTASSPYTECKFFRLFYNAYRPGQRTILREWGESALNDYSLSRCPLPDIGIFQFRPFQPDTFVTSTISPGAENTCDGRAPFNIEDTQPVRKVPRIDFSTTPGHECFVTTEDPFIETANMITNPVNYMNMMQLAMEEASRCAQEAEITTDDGSGDIEEDKTTTTAETMHATSHSLNEEDALDETFIEEVPFTPTVLPQDSFEESLAADGPFLTTTCENFQPQSLINELKSSQSPALDWKDVLHESTCTWFDFLGWGISTSGYRAPKFRCKVCHRLLSQGILVDRPGSKYINKIMKNGQGVGGLCAKRDNRKIIQKHLKNPLHLIAMEFIKLFEDGLRGDELKKKFQEKGSLYRKFLEATENLFVTVYQGVHLDITFYKCEKLRELLTYFGVDLGHLYANPGGCKMIALSISDSMHMEFVSYLKSSRPEFSLLIDLSTDVSKLSTAAFLIQTYDKDQQLRVYLYRVVYVSDETSDTIWNTFLAQIQADGIESFVREKCVGFASDSGSNVLRFRELLQRFVDHELITTRCYSHRLENAHKKAWLKKPYLLKVDAAVNSIYRIFHMSAKKNQILQLQQRYLGDSYFEVKKYHKIRWIAGKRRALSSVLQHWKTILGALEEIGGDSSFDRDTRDDAQTVAATLKDAKFIATLAFVIDICDVMAEMSLGLQNRGTTLIGKRKMREDAIAKIRNFKTTNGKNLQQVLDSAQPLDEEDPRFRTSVADFELRPINYLSIDLAHPQTDSTDMLHRNREGYIDELITEINSYFPSDSTDGFDIFDPLQWPQNDDDLRNYGNTRLTSMNRHLLWNFDGRNLIPEWATLKESVKGHPEYLKRREDTPEEFWSFFLSDEAGLDWPPALKTIIRNILTAPASTAEVERIFSFYTSTKTVRRFRLDVKSVDAIIRLKFNGAKRLGDFQAVDYIPAFLKSHARSNDESISAKRQRLYRGDNEDLIADDDDYDDDFEEDTSLDDEDP